jgi:hypothetical protein
MRLSQKCRKGSKRERSVNGPSVNLDALHFDDVMSRLIFSHSGLPFTGRGLLWLGLRRCLSHWRGPLYPGFARITFAGRRRLI